MATLLYRLGRWSFRGRWIVAGAWVILLAALIGLVVAGGAKLDDKFSIPGSQSQQALDELRRISPAAAGASAQIVFAAPAGSSVADPAYRSAIAQVVAAARNAPQVAQVTDPFTAKALAPDGQAAIAPVQYATDQAGLQKTSVAALEQTLAPARAAGLDVAVGGDAFASRGVKVGPTELIGVGVAIAVLALTFGSLLAAGMNLLTALAGIAVGLTGLLGLTRVITLSSTAPTLALMIGLAVGIDYTLFILSRHRSLLAAGTDPEEAAGRAAGTAGSAVVFAGLTVIIALAGLSVVGIPFLTVMGLGAAGTVLVAVLVALTLLPALLGFAGKRLAPKPGSRTARRELAEAGTNPAKAGSPAWTGGSRWATLVTRHPLLTIAGTVAVLAVMAVPALQLRLALPDNSTAGRETTQRQAYDLVGQHFGPGFNSPLLVLATGLEPATAQHTLDGLAARIGGIPAASPGQFTGGMPGVAYAAPRLLGPTAGILQVIPKTSGQDQATTDLVGSLREKIPGLEGESGAHLAVTGHTAVQIDVSSRLAGALLPFTLVVVGLSLLLLLIVFRSVLVPVKAAIGFLLSVGASFGAVVAVFQWGWLNGILGVPSTGPIISFMPILLMAVLFGLAMDYEVFLVSRIREEYVHTGRARESVIAGARHASRVVVAAALIMLAVFASFVGIEDVTIKAIALGLATGVAVDAFVVRMTLVPAVLALLGDRAWWLPRWLDRLLPQVDIEGASLRTATEPALEPELAAAH
ncbi:MAG: putative drug exporter of the superfamily [Cryptosporangiaceae bacterium]|nr:putative drug exporter of the superfamily [Cryptosporangiaceae bacterium]